VNIRTGRVLSCLIMAVLVAAGFGCGSQTKTAESTPAALLGSMPLPALAIRSHENNGSLCYSISERSTDALVDQNCPMLELDQYEFSFGQRSEFGGDIYAVIWLRDDVAVTSSKTRFERSVEGWTIFEVGESAYAEFTVRIDEMVYACAIGTAVSCLPQ